MIQNTIIENIFLEEKQYKLYTNNLLERNSMTILSLYYILNVLSGILALKSK